VATEGPTTSNIHVLVDRKMTMPSAFSQNKNPWIHGREDVRPMLLVAKRAEVNISRVSFSYPTVNQHAYRWKIINL